MRRDKVIRNILIKLIVRRGWQWSGPTQTNTRMRHRDVGELFKLSRRRIGQIATEPLRIERGCIVTSRMCQPEVSV